MNYASQHHRISITHPRIFVRCLHKRMGCSCVRPTLHILFEKECKCGNGIRSAAINTCLFRMARPMRERHTLKHIRRSLRTQYFHDKNQWSPITASVVDSSWLVKRPSLSSGSFIPARLCGRCDIGADPQPERARIDINVLMKLSRSGITMRDNKYFRGAIVIKAN